tara:strand:- start:3513 stop:4124 length:612 start_codon:yes stop_codon:yes gene_type:complete
MSKNKLSIYLVILIGAIAMGWVVKDLSPASLNKEKHPQTTLESDSDVQRIGELTALINPNWIREKPSSSMRTAQFRLPAQTKDIEDAELAIFSGIGGSVDENLNRWFGQFQQPDGSESKSKARVRNFTVGGMTTTIADLTGTFTGGGMPMSDSVEKKDYRLLAAIVNGDSNIYYFKLLGPRSTVGHWAEAFGQFIGNLRKNST